MPPAPLLVDYKAVQVDPSVEPSIRYAVAYAASQLSTTQLTECAAPRSTDSHCGLANAEDQRVPVLPSTALVAGVPTFSVEDAVTAAPRDSSPVCGCPGGCGEPPTGVPNRVSVTVIAVGAPSWMYEAGVRGGVGLHRHRRAGVLAPHLIDVRVVVGGREQARVDTVAGRDDPQVAALDQPAEVGQRGDGGQDPVAAAVDQGAGGLSGGTHQVKSLRGSAFSGR
jgi:hypothetical protein